MSFLNKKNFGVAIIFFISIFLSSRMSSQVTIGSDKKPEPFSVLEIEGSGGLRLPQLNGEQRKALALQGNNLAKGLLIYNLDTNVIESWDGEKWIAVNGLWQTVGTKNTAIPNNMNIYQNNKIGIGDFGEADATVSAKLDIVGTNLEAPLRLRNIPDANKKQVPGINYNNTSGLFIDTEGYVVKKPFPPQTDSRSVTFDGEYECSTTNKRMVSINNGSILDFKILSGFTFGETAIGAIIYANVAWSRLVGFQLKCWGADVPAISTNQFKMEISPDRNTVSFNFTTGANLILSVVKNELVYKTNIDRTGVTFRVYDSFRTR